MTSGATEFRELYDRYAPDVRRFALGLCADPVLAEDLTSETFARAWTAHGRIRQDTVKAYLFTITRNLHRDWRRRTRRHDALGEDLADTGASPERQAQDRSDLDRALSAMQRLSEGDRAALLMRAHDQMSYEQIAQALGLSVGAAKVKVHRARLRLLRAVNTPDETTPSEEP
jgi:RNA polymerase sigma-70 factor (ECF subfamily)